MDALDRIPQELLENQAQAAHTIHLRILAASALITNRIIAYRALHPDVNFQLYQADTHSAFDLCVSAVRADRPDLDAEEDNMIMLEEDLYLAVPANSSYGRKDSIRLSETKNAGYICLAGSRPIRQISNSYFAEAGISPRIIFESDTTESVRNLIAAGLGIGFWPQYSWGPLEGSAGPLAPNSSVKPVSYTHLKVQGLRCNLFAGIVNSVQLFLVKLHLLCHVDAAHLRNKRQHHYNHQNADGKRHRIAQADSCRSCALIGFNLFFIERRCIVQC